VLVGVDVFSQKIKRMVAANNSALFCSNARSPNSAKNFQPHHFKRIYHAEHDHGGLPHIANRPTQCPKSHHQKNYSTTQHQLAPIDPTQNKTQPQNHEPLNTTIEHPYQVANTQPLNDAPNKTNLTEVNPPILAPPIQKTTTIPSWNVPDSHSPHMDPTVLEAYHRVVNHHPDLKSSKALFNVALQREAEIHIQLEGLRHINEILKI